MPYLGVIALVVCENLKENRLRNGNKLKWLKNMKKQNLFAFFSCQWHFVI